MGLPDGWKSFKIGLAALIQYRRVISSQPVTQPATQPRCRSIYRAYYVARVKRKHTCRRVTKTRTCCSVTGWRRLGNPSHTSVPRRTRSRRAAWAERRRQGTTGPASRPLAAWSYHTCATTPASHLPASAAPAAQVCTGYRWCPVPRADCESRYSYTATHSTTNILTPTWLDE